MNNNNNTTPPPPGRVHTPPTPLHGPQYDSYEPYSPRRSSRLHAKREQSPRATVKSQASAATNPQSAQSKHSYPNSSPQSHATSTPRKKPTIKRTSSQHISPPSSPLSPSNEPPSTRPKSNTQSFARQNNSTSSSTYRRDVSPTSLNLNQETPRAHRRVNHISSRTMLPTPAKTPRKRHKQHGSDLNSTARVLFPHLPASVEEAMPSPRKARKARHAGLTLDSLDDDAEHPGGQIQIYTDSKERIPTEDDDDDVENPFLTRRGTRSAKSKAGTKQNSSSKTKYGMTKEIDEAVDRGEGLVYVFRGKKMFRPIEQPESTADDRIEGTNEAAESPGEAELRRQAGRDANEPIPRSSLKPRLLFPPKEETPDPDHIDEEAITDIEAQQETDPDDSHIITPVKPAFRPATPPTTGRKRKNQPANVTPISDAADSTTTYPHGRQAFSNGLDPAGDYITLPKMRNGRSSKTSPFDSWTRTKPGVSGSTSGSAAGSTSPETVKSPRARTGSGKRQGEVLERPSDGGKRSKNDVHHSA